MTDLDPGVPLGKPKLSILKIPLNICGLALRE